MTDTRTVQDVYRARQDRIEHPTGKFDGARRWYPSDTEHRPCCNRVRTPSRAWPYSLMVHCRTLRHIRALIGGNS